MTTWTQLTQPEKLSLVLQLQAFRLAAMKNYERRSTANAVSRVRTKKPPKKLTFKSPELEALFNSLPPELQKAISR